MKSRLAWIVVASAAVACARGTPASAAPPGVKIWESTQDHVSEGDVIVAGDPDALYAQLADYGRWTAVFKDVASVTVVSRGQPEDAVKLVTTDGKTNNLRFHNDAGKRVVHFRDTGGRAVVWADIGFEPAAQAGMTRVHARIYADVPGFAGWFVSDGRLKRERQKKIASDLTSIRDFVGRGAAVATP
jgi:uncharacterized membrane protein